MRGIQLVLLVLLSLASGACSVLPQCLPGDVSHGLWPFSHTEQARTPAEGDGCRETALQTDQDKDGIADAMDGCPATPEGQAVDSRGCPVRCSLHLQVEFDTSSDTIATGQLPRLERLAMLLRDNPSLEAAVEGHSDTMGDPQHNRELARRRAEQVQNILQDQYQIPAERLRVEAYGSSRPLVSNETASGRARNRRVEIRLQGPYADHEGWLALGRPNNCLFASNSATLDVAARQRLDALGRHLRAHPDELAAVTGHSDSLGDRHSNLMLSRARAEAVQGYLSQRWGIAADRMPVTALGDAMPAASNETVQGRALNRRVSIAVHRGMPPELLAARTRVCEEQARDPAASWRDRSVPHVAFQTQTPLEFGNGQTELTPEMRRRLEDIGVMLVARPELRVIVQGHSDRLGDPLQEQALARQRAEAVRRLLLDRFALAPDRLDVRSYGADLPVATNGTEEGRQRNRRVELRILSES